MKQRQIERARFLQERVVGDVPVRPYVLTLPPPLRVYATYDPELVTEILAIHTKAIARPLKWKAKKALDLSAVEDAHPGILTGIQRWSTKLDPNLHFHSLGTDGVFYQLIPDGLVEFHELKAPTDEEIDAVAWEICRRTRDLLVRKDMWEDTPDDAGDVVLAGRDGKPRSLKTVSGILSLPGHRPRKCRFFGTAAQQDSDKPVSQDGAYAFNLFARDGVRRGDGKNLRRVLRYILSPPFTDEQLRPGDNGGVILDLKRERLDGTESWHFPDDGFMDKLVQLCPRPRANLIRLHCVWAANAKLRDGAVPQLDEPDPAPPPPPDSDETAEDYKAWAVLQSRTYDHDIKRCRRCGGRLQLIALKCERINYRRKSGVPPDTPP